MEKNILKNVPQKSAKMRKSILKKLLPHLNRHLKNKDDLNSEKQKNYFKMGQ